MLRTDTAVLIARAEMKGATFRISEGIVEVKGLDVLPAPLVDELRKSREEVLAHLSAGRGDPDDEVRAHLCAWAAELAEQDQVLPGPIAYLEAPLRQVSTTRVSWYAAHYLNTITMARIMQRTGGWGTCTAGWWREREAEAVGALAALRAALGVDQGVRDG